MRRFPLGRTLRNLRFNVFNFKPVTHRPAFRSSNHPFCTNAQLLEASYSQWFKHASKELPAKIITQLKETLDRQHAQNQSTPRSVAAPVSSVAFVPATQSTMDDLQPETAEKSAFTPVWSDLFRTDSIQEIASVLRQQAEAGNYMDTELLLSLLHGFVAECGSSPENDGVPEVALCEPDPQLDTYTRYYSRLRARIPFLYEVCQLYEARLFENRAFQELYVRLCYHHNDMDKMQQLLYSYLNHASYDAPTLNYVFISLIRNYEVEFAKGLFSNLLGLGRPVDPLVLEVVVSQLVSVQALFGNVVYVFQAWLRSQSATPTPKTLAVLVHEYAKYGNVDEVQTLRQLISRLGLADNFHVQLAMLQSSIILREPTHFKKNITEQDFNAAGTILRGLRQTGSKVEIKHFFQLMVLFLSKFSDLSMVESFISRFRDDYIHNESLHRVISRYFMRHDQFLPLLDYLQKSAVAFDVSYLRDLFVCFVKTYPYQAPEFADKFHNFVRRSGRLSQPTMDVVLKALQLRPTESQLTPFCMEPAGFDTRKYESSTWKRIEWKPTSGGDQPSAAIQVDFRISRGLRDVLRKGIRPDYKVIETTFRRLNPENRTKLLGFLRAMRFPAADYDKLAILNLQLNKDKRALEGFVKTQPMADLNSNNIIMLGRMLLNKSLYQTNNELLHSVRAAEMNDRTRMALLNLQLRNYLRQGHYTHMTAAIERFPIDEVVLSPYLYKQCRYIEKDLARRLARDERTTESTERRKANKSKQEGTAALVNLRGLLGDIRVRLDRDKIEINARVHEMFLWLVEWMDQRKS